MLPSTPQGFLQDAARRLVGGGDYARGGVLRPLMRLDGYVFVICCAVAASTLTANAGDGGWADGWEGAWQARATIWWCKTVSRITI